MIPTKKDIVQARQRIGGLVHKTPLLSSRLLSEAAGGPVFLKAENLQRVGAFKFRGALNAVKSLTAEERDRGVTTFSSGNHGQALALAARLEGARAVIFMPEGAPVPKVEAARSYGADVRFAGTTSPERKEAAEKLAEEEGHIIIPPFDNERIIAGQGTVGLEILEDLPDVDVILIPVGGGGLLAGVSLAVLDSRPQVEIFGVEPAGAPALDQALRNGGPVTIDPPETIADGLMPMRLGELPFEVVQERIAGCILVEDSEILDATRFLLLRARLVVEPSGAAGVAVLLAGKLKLDGRKAVVVLSGGNINPELMSELVLSNVED